MRHLEQALREAVDRLIAEYSTKLGAFDTIHIVGDEVQKIADKEQFEASIDAGGHWQPNAVNPDANPLIEPTQAAEDFVDAMYEKPLVYPDNLALSTEDDDDPSQYPHYAHPLPVVYCKGRKATCVAVDGGRTYIQYLDDLSSEWVWTEQITKADWLYVGAEVYYQPTGLIVRVLELSTDEALTQPYGLGQAWVSKKSLRQLPPH